MTPDATATRHLPAEPAPDSRWSAFAQGVSAVTTKVKDEAGKTVEASEIVFRSRMTWALVVGSILVGMWIQGKLSEVDSVNSRQEELLTAVKSVQTTLAKMEDDLRDAVRERADLQAELNSLEEDLKEQKTEHRLLKDFVEGRVGHLPYRPSGEPP